MLAIAKYGKSVLSGNLTLLHQGKTRDTYAGSWPKKTPGYPPLLVVASRRISTHNVVHQSWINSKDEVLTALTVFWLERLEAQEFNTHLLACGRKIYDYLPGKEEDYPVKNLHHRAIVVKPLRIIPVEFVYRGYLAGSLWSNYYSQGLKNPYGVELPPGLPLMHKFDRPIFTPTEKSETDEPMQAAGVDDSFHQPTMVGESVFNFGRAHLNKVGLELVDTKFEFGIDEDNQILLADEVLTPDSSRFARLADLKEGENPPWLDKQRARNVAEGMWAGGERRPLIFNPPVARELTETYLEIFEFIVGMPLAQFQRERFD